MSKEAKAIRNQVRNVVQEVLPEVLTKEVIEAITGQLHERMKKLEVDTKEILHKMNERHKDTMGYLVRQVSTSENK